MRKQLNNNRRESNGSSFESLERRTMFSGAYVPLPMPEALVHDMEFNCEQAPHSLRITFTEDVGATLDPSDLLLNNNSLTRLTGDQLQMAYDANSNTAVFTFPEFDRGILPEGRWTATLLTDGIIAEPTVSPSPRSAPSIRNPSPTTEGSGGDENGNVTYEFSYLSGDATKDGIVDINDYNIVASNFGKSNQTFSTGDFDYDGRVGIGDWMIVTSRFGRNLDAPVIDDGDLFSDKPVDGPSPVTE